MKISYRETFGLGSMICVEMQAHGCFDYVAPKLRMLR